MKTTILVFIMLAFTYVSSAQKLSESEVPAAVKSAFTSMYPGAEQVKWEMEDGKYEAEFKESGTEISVLFESSGTYVQTETEIQVSSLPENVHKYVKENLAGKTIKEASKITDTGGVITYEAEVDNNDYLFNENGEFIKKNTESPESEDENK